MTGLCQGFSRIDAVLNHGAQAFFQRDIADFSFDQRDTHIVADDITPCVMIFVVSVDEFVLKLVDFHGEIGCLIRRGRCTGARKPYTYAQKKLRYIFMKSVIISAHTCCRAAPQGSTSEMNLSHQCEGGIDQFDAPRVECPPTLLPTGHNVVGMAGRKLLGNPSRCAVDRLVARRDDDMHLKIPF